MMTPKEECEALLSAVMPFAEKMLAKNRESFPFGATMSLSGDIAASAAGTGEEQPQADAVISLLETAFRAGAAEGELKATALAVDVRVVPPGKSEKQDAVEVRLYYRGDYSVRIVFPTPSDTGELRVEPAICGAR